MSKGFAFLTYHDPKDNNLVLVTMSGQNLVVGKATFGSTDHSLVHGVYEAYRPTKADLLFNTLGRLFTAYIQCYSGHSCRMDDLILAKDTDAARRHLVKVSL